MYRRRNPMAELDVQVYRTMYGMYPEAPVDYTSNPEKAGEMLCWLSATFGDIGLSIDSQDSPLWSAWAYKWKGVEEPICIDYWIMDSDTVQEAIAKLIVATNKPGANFEEVENGD